MKFEARIFSSLVFTGLFFGNYCTRFIKTPICFGLELLSHRQGVIFSRHKQRAACHKMVKYKIYYVSRSQWPRGLRRTSAAKRLLGLWVRIPPEQWMFVSCTVFVLSGKGVCDGPIPRPEESYRLWCVSECDQVKINNLDTYCE
jgi:hypothetical protein